MPGRSPRRGGQSTKNARRRDGRFAAHARRKTEARPRACPAGPRGAISAPSRAARTCNARSRTSLRDARRIAIEPSRASAACSRPPRHHRRPSPRARVQPNDAPSVAPRVTGRAHCRHSTADGCSRAGRKARRTLPSATSAIAPSIVSEQTGATTSHLACLRSTPRKQCRMSCAHSRRRRGTPLARNNFV